MKKAFSLPLLLLSFFSLIKAQDMPKFSTDTEEYWYYIRFANGGAMLQDMGEGQPLKTQQAARTDAQLWKLLGTRSNCEIVSKKGCHIYYDNAAGKGRFLSATRAKGDLRLVPTSSSSYAPAWEILLRTTDTRAMNQQGGVGPERTLGLWNIGDPNNPLYFLPSSEVYLRPAKVEEYGIDSILTDKTENAYTLWYTQPVTNRTGANPWMEYALPIGNGQLGAMIYGGIRRDIIQFNEKTLWTGSPTQRGSYQNFGELYIDDLSTHRFSVTDSSRFVQNYIRKLDLSTATATTTWRSADGTIFERTYMASYPDQCIIIRLKASKPGSLSNRFYLYNPFGQKPTYQNGQGLYHGKLTTISYCAGLRIIPQGGQLITDEEGITVRGADEILVILTGGTDFDPLSPTYTRHTDRLNENILQRIRKAAQKGWKALYRAHREDYGSFFHRVHFSLADAINDRPTNVLVDTYAHDFTPAVRQMLEQLYFNYGRYLLISSSRGVDLPANLQGLWNNLSNPPWESDIHSNINVQMNYWPAEITNLSEMHIPFLNYIRNMALIQPQWQQYARKSGQTVGWTCFTQNNIFGHSDFAENYVIANAWYCMHLWQHYRYTLDRRFLKEQALPVMLSCTRYWMERLIKADDGTYECPKEWSPEHGPSAENGVAHAQQLTWDLFHNTLKAIHTLGPKAAGVDLAFVDSLSEKFSHLDTGLSTETYTGTFGSPHSGIETGTLILREWKYTDFATGNRGEKGHRHLSHLIGLYPGDQITASGPYFVPAVNSLKLRGDESTGWSMGWKINLWARVADGNHAHRLLETALKHSTSYSIDQYAGGIYYNLFDSHAPFQIDGNFGTCAGIAEMLLQSHTDTINLLPAPPLCWPKGTITGLRATNHFEVDQQWEKGKLSQAVIRSLSGGTCRLSYPDIATATLTDNNGKIITPERLDRNHIVFTSQKGKSYKLVMHP